MGTNDRTEQAKLSESQACDLTSEVGADRDTVSGKASAHVTVTAEELRHLAEDCAFFKAEHFRSAAPEAIRKSDVNAAEAELSAIVHSACSDRD